MTKATLPSPAKLPSLSVEERYAVGKALRANVSRSSHAEWKAAKDRPDPISILEESNRSRLADLVPIRYGRMSVSPLAFLRGAAAIMAHDLAATPQSGLRTQICGDAHLSNFGAYATPERNLVFDVNDFDETLKGPWEWDIKRLATSAVLAGRHNGFSRAACRQAALACVRSYREHMREFSTMGYRDIWYTNIGSELMLKFMRSGNRDLVQKTIAQNRQPGALLHRLPKLMVEIGDEYCIKDDPPLVTHINDAEITGAIKATLKEYRATLPEERATLLDRYHYVDFAQKIVGVGSVGTRCYVVLLLGKDSDDALFLQVKEARASVLEPYIGPSPYSNHAHRVVNGQRLMQAASDIFLGWTRIGSIDYYVRQLRDMKLSTNIEIMDRNGLSAYVSLCGWALARAHARSGDPAPITGYLGSRAVFDEAVADFAESYADQTERDYKALLAAIKSGRVTAKVDV